MTGVTYPIVVSVMTDHDAQVVVCELCHTEGPWSPAADPYRPDPGCEACGGLVVFKFVEAGGGPGHG